MSSKPVRAQLLSSSFAIRAKPWKAEKFSHGVRATVRGYSLMVQLFRESRDLTAEPFNPLSISPSLRSAANSPAAMESKRRLARAAGWSLLLLRCVDVGRECTRGRGRALVTDCEKASSCWEEQPEEDDGGEPLFADPLV
ncbi:hypothetical protein KM043_004987 [Ampulex compressa]|nr:hypothetical protein KM043_004987 [Ampulex compressa]